MKKALALIAQFLLFAVPFLASPVLGVFDPLHLKPWFVSHPTLTSTRYFSPEGLLLTCALYLLILAMEAAAKRLRTVGTITSIAFAAALLCGALLRWGWGTHELF